MPLLLAARVGGRGLIRLTRLLGLVGLLFDRASAGFGRAGERGDPGEVLR
ncbi:hypothetical protein [Streptomyces sp. NPDC092307]